MSDNSSTLLALAIIRASIEHDTDRAGFIATKMSFEELATAFGTLSIRLIASISATTSVDRLEIVERIKKELLEEEVSE